MIERFVDPDKIDVHADCIEMDELFSGERVREGRELKGFELVEVGEVESEGIEVVGECSDLLGIHVIVSGVSDDAAQAIESIFSEVINRMKGVEYRFRKENVRIIVSRDAEGRFTPDCVGKVVFDAVKAIPAVERVRVRIVCDEEEFERVLSRSSRVHAEREERASRLRERDVDTFYGCISCQVYLPNHVCIITPERPSPCGTLYNEAKSAEELKLVHYYFPVEKGEEIDGEKGEYEGVNRTVQEKSDFRIERVKLHSALENPPSTGNYAEAIVFYIPEENGFGIVDRGYKKKTPIGLTFDEMEKLIVGQQVEGFVGVSFAYMKSKSFLKGDGGWEKVRWVSPNVYDFIMEFLPDDVLRRIRTSS
ncbi:CO dehydrogenase/acetyl-CoA synthase beta subunit [Geoglobus ahangari]|uniref:CO-methylating acetyl-CoA synthase n=1 Tax=Geoglobus ahangari TaxID=113653 RepID=A0A0F7IFB1_9EURY|nr:hypothetical protein [Geoglobus ahangari]AKG91753.1 CO dehydrogenase/acetyl-CoA synthase beta subunit [Geoglobus ahangari]